jgi:glycosyltransferase involved in cell wall biosynthesis
MLDDLQTVGIYNGVQHHRSKGENVRICYVVLSPAFGMHQYTADIANRFAEAALDDASTSWSATVVTLQTAPLDRYAPQVKVQATANIQGTGLQKNNFNAVEFQRTYRAIQDSNPDVVHFTGPHLWNPLLLLKLKRAGIPTIHTIHDLDPHSGTSYGRLLHVWNASILRLASRILVHGRIYRDRLVQIGMRADRVVHTPLLHLFLSHNMETILRSSPPRRSYEPFVLFFARIEAYKGVDVLIEAMRQLGPEAARAVIAGKGDGQHLVTSELPTNVDIRNRLLEDAEAIDLFTRCSIVVLPYRDATQSALIAAAYFFEKPVVVTRTGALPEYVSEGETGWVVEPGDEGALAACLATALRDPERLKRMGQAGRAWYNAQYRQEHRTLRTMYERALQHSEMAQIGQEYVERGQ